jgi:hypothetical protein
MIVIIPIAFMSNRNVTHRYLAASIALAIAAVAVAVAIATGAGTPSARGAAQAAQATGTLSFQPVLGLPASNVAIIGASPGEAPGEVWAQGRVGNVPASADGQSLADTETLLRYTSASETWQLVPVDDAQGNPLKFTWWGSEVTGGGGVVLAGGEDTSEAGDGFAGTESIVTRNPGGAFVQVKAPGSKALAKAGEAPAKSGEAPVLESGELLYPLGSSAGRSSVDPLFAALDEPGGDTGAFVVPVWGEASSSPGTGSGGGSTEPKGTGSGEPTGEPTTPLGPGVLHYDGSGWSREPLCTEYTAGKCTPAPATLDPLAIAASSPQDAWLLATSSSGTPALFRRTAPPSGSEPSSTPVWVQVQFSSGLLASGGVPAGESLTARKGGPLLTATGQGVWVDLALNGSGVSGSATLLASASSPGTALGTWCYPTSLCPAGTPSLGAELPSDYASFAWAGSSGEPGTRLITGLPDGALLRLQPGQPAFSYEIGGGVSGGKVVGPGGVTLGELPGTASAEAGGAAFVSPDEGWLGDDTSFSSSFEPQVIHATTTPSADRLTSWPVPFRRPLLAIASQPGTTPGAAGAQALAVGVDGEIARYQPGEGWEPESLYNSNGERKAPNLRGVAWPEPGRAYAVGDNGEMWLWQADTGLWEPDPGKPLGLDDQLTAIAFSPTDPDLGYAVGKQGTLLSYGKSWTQESPPAGLSEANFTSIAFAGVEAIATYRMLSHSPSNPDQEIGGLIVNNGSGWQVEPSAEALLAQLPPQDTVLSRAAGLPDGGAVAAGPGLVIERDSTTGSWRFSTAPLPEAGDVAALAAVQEGSSVRALISIDPGGAAEYGEIDNPPGPPLGQYGELLGPDPLLKSGYLLRETASGWHDEEDEDYAHYSGSDAEDLPGWPDAVLALLVEPSGEQGWAVGGQTGEELASSPKSGTQEAIQTAGVMRYGAGTSPPQSTSAPISLPAGEASFAVGGDAQCASACADFANEQLGPDAWLSGAISRAGQIPGLRAFLYTGSRIAPTGPYLTFGPGAFERELDRYAGLLGGSRLPVYTTISPSDVPSGGSVAPFTEALGAFMPGSEAAAEKAYYSVSSPGASGGTVRIIVLAYSTATLGGTQEAWLKSELESAKNAGEPAIVLGSENISQPGAADYAADAATVDQLLLAGGASAYLFDSPEENVAQSIGSGPCAIPAYGSGTLGYVHPNLAEPNDFLGASGFLVVSVNAAKRCASSGAASVSVELIPSIEQLGLEASDGTLLRRSQVALFQGLARRPLGGESTIKSGVNTIEAETPDPYTPIPERCLGSNCSQFIAPTYSFTSSNPEIGQFVEQNPNVERPEVQQVKGKPVPDSASGLFCAYNAGTTTVTLTTGGLSYSEPVTVQPGSIEQPCETVPLNKPPAAGESQSLSPIAPLLPEAEEPSPATNPSLSLTPPPPPTPVAPTVSHHHAVPTALPLFAAALAPLPLRAALPPPSPQPARPAPPSGTSEVSEPVGVAEKEQEEESAVDVVHNMASYEPGGNTLPPWSPLPLIVIAAAAGTSLRRRRRPGSKPMLARASAHAGEDRRRR